MSTIYLKLGGSLITDKAGVEAARPDVLRRLAAEMAAARRENPRLSLLLGHGSGSFGHVAGARHGTRQGVSTADQWRGFVEVSDAALRLNRRVVAALLAAGLPAMSFSPSASARVQDGRMVDLATAPIAAALAHGLLPVVHGDVAFDAGRGGTIISTEEVMACLLEAIPAGWFLLAGETDGVYSQSGSTIPRITRAAFTGVAPALGSARGTDVTGGMASKVEQMLALVERHPDLRIRIFSGQTPGALRELLDDPSLPLGTEISP